MKVVVGTGNAAMDQALAEVATATGHEAAVCAYLEAVTEKAKGAQAAVVGAELPGADAKGLLGGIVALRLEGVRVFYLAGDREQADRDLLTQAVAVGVYDIVFDPVDPRELVAALQASPSLRRALAAVRRPGERTVGTPRLAAALQGATERPGEVPSRERSRRTRGVRPSRSPRPVAEGAEDAVRPATEPATVPFTGGLTVFLGALPGCGTSTAAIAYARGAAADGNPVLLMDAHAERAHLAHYLLGRDLNLLNEGDAALSWRHPRGGVPVAPARIAPDLYLLPLAPDPDAVLGAAWSEAPDAAVRWLPGGATLDLVCRAGASPGQARMLIEALAAGGALTVAARGRALAEADRALWERELGVCVLSGAARVAGPAAQLVAQLTASLRRHAAVSPNVVVDLGAPPALVQGNADPRVAWAAQMGRTIVITRDDDLGVAAADRLLRTLRSEAERAGRALQAEVLLLFHRVPTAAPRPR